MAPEVLAKKKYTTAADVYRFSFCLILHFEFFFFFFLLQALEY
jgi:hypothetical protein